MSIKELKELKNKFIKDHNLKEKEINKLRWEEVREKKEYKNLLEDFNKFRKIYVDTLLKYSIKKNKCNDCKISIAGSNDLTSDYDITVNSEIRASKVAETFNNTFLKLWDNVSSAEIFDTNLYGIGFFTIIKKNEKIPKMYNSFNYKEKRYLYLNCPSNDILKICINDKKNQRIMAIMQMFKQHDLYKNKKSKKPDILNKLIKLENYDLYKKKYKDLIGNINIKNINETNKEYIKRIKLVEDSYKNNKNSNNLKKLIEHKQLISNSMFFGNETYLTQGSFFHVVGIMQMKIESLEKIITKSELLDSIIENYSYIYMEYQDSKNLKDFLTLISKYMQRIIDGIQRYNSHKKYQKFIKQLLVTKRLRRNDIYEYQEIFIRFLYSKININIDSKTTIEDIIIDITKFINNEISNFPFIILN